ncbi:MAG: hypothetical protein J3K34DRAFT_461995 [Monoraphidium minutum]|nr:MAG: hypothetical protein J3K34DRAFT_461995 [Monoraphidium minutum]
MPLGVEQWLRSHIPRKARTALYAGKKIVTGNKISNDYEKKSRRIWKPNVVRKHLYSAALGQEVQLKLTTTALRQIDRSGGLDRYLLKTPDRLLHSDVGSDLKFRIGLIYKQRWFEEAAARRMQATAAAVGIEGGAGASAAALTPGRRQQAGQQQQQEQQQAGQQRPQQQLEGPPDR